MWEAAERQGVRSAALNFFGRWSSKKASARPTSIPKCHGRIANPTIRCWPKASVCSKMSGPGHPRLIALYFPIPDEVAHYNGTTAPKTEAAVRKADAIVGKLMAAIRALPPDARRHARHRHRSRHDRCRPARECRPADERIRHQGQTGDRRRDLVPLSRRSEGRRRASPRISRPTNTAFDVYRKGHFPAYAHLGNGPRVPDLLLVDPSALLHRRPGSAAAMGRHAGHQLVLAGRLHAVHRRAQGHAWLRSAHHRDARHLLCLGRGCRAW